MIGSSSNFYQLGASLPVDAPSYVQRQADEEFYQKLQAGKFCYVLNSRQMGKSSLRVQTMQRLQKQGTVCAAIDLTGIGKVSQEQWYGGIVYNLSESCQLEDKFDFDWQIWWQKHQNILSPVQCLNLFIEKVLLAKIQQPIVIFVDEIDKVLSQDFSLDDFFALIRFFQNQRVDNRIFERLTFALLGVATPGDLITNKTQTPFNIGEAIELHGFQIDEVEPLIKGLQGKFNYPQGVMAEILDWTGGQPFLTQKLCKFMVEESEKDNPRYVEEVVKSRIIENWESQDDPEHLRTIRDRILANEQRAGYLLELYQHIQQQGEVAASNSVEFSELRLSGLVVQREGKLRVYNQVYQQVFNQSWVETQLKNLRPYSENFRFWVASGYSDESRLLQGKALEGAEKWAKGKDLSFQDKQFLAASREKEIAVRNKAAELERERKDREAAEQRNQVLSEANIKAKQRIRNGTAVLFLAVFVAVILGVFATREGNKALQAQEKFKQANTEAEEAYKNFKYANTKAGEERTKVIALQQQAQQLQKNADGAKLQAQQATEKAKEEQAKAEQAQINADDANQKAIEAKKQAEEEQQKAQQAQKIADETNRNAKVAKQEAQNLQNQLNLAKKNIENVQKLSQLAGYLRNENLISESDEALRQAGLSFRVNEHNLKQALLLASMAQAYQQLKKPDEAQHNITESLNYLQDKSNNINSEQGLQIKVLTKKTEGDLLLEKDKTKAIEAYKEGYNIIKKNPDQTNPFSKNQIITAKDIEYIHGKLLQLLVTNKSQENLRLEVEASLKQHYYAELNNLLANQNWQEADEKTASIVSFKLSCPDIEKIDKLWLKHSEGRFGFSVQKQIWLYHANRLSITEVTEKDKKALKGFLSQVGWDEQRYEDIINKLNKNKHSYKKLAPGTLPYLVHSGITDSNDEKANFKGFKFYIYDFQQEALSSAKIFFSQKCELGYVAGATLFLLPAKGYISNLNNRRSRYHVNILNSVGTPIYAAADGVVEKAGWNNGGYGNLVDIRHIDGSLTRYGHNSKILVRTGQQVRQGEIIALMGSTGHSTRPHLHFEIHKPGGERVNINM